MLTRSSLLHQVAHETGEYPSIATLLAQIQGGLILRLRDLFQQLKACGAQGFRQRRERGGVNAAHLVMPVLQHGIVGHTRLVVEPLDRVALGFRDRANAQAQHSDAFLLDQSANLH